MKLIETLRDEHALIDRMLGALRTYVDTLAGGRADPQDGPRFAAFFTEFAGHYHHDREERGLFDALVNEAELPRERGPVHALTHDHARMAQWLGEMTPLLAQAPRSDDERTRLRTLATRYSHALWRHIDAENSVLYPEGEERLARCGVRELPDRPPNAAEATARDHAAALLARYPFVEDAVLARGDGCSMCPAHGETCEGLEAEWWSDLEWDEFFER